MQKLRWKGGSARWLGRGERYKFFWMGIDGGSGGVGMLLAEWWVNKVMAVQRVSERILVLKLLVERRVFNIVTAYCPTDQEVTGREGFLLGSDG